MCPIDLTQTCLDTPFKCGNSDLFGGNRSLSRAFFMLGSPELQPHQGLLLPTLSISEPLRENGTVGCLRFAEGNSVRLAFDSVLLKCSWMTSLFRGGKRKKKETRYRCVSVVEGGGYPYRPADKKQSIFGSALWFYFSTKPQS